MHYVVGLGNPGSEYESTRHNTGRIVLAHFLRSHSFPDLVASKKYASLIAEGIVGDEAVTVLMPETFMNKSGSAVAKLVTSSKKAKQLVVVYDDVDLPLGTVRVAFGRSSGGHNGVESIIRALKTKDFIRIRVGICPRTPAGKLKKPKGEPAVLDFLLGEFKKPEVLVLQKVGVRVNDVLRTVVEKGYVAAMNEYN